MEAKLKQWVGALQAQQGAELVSVILYGSAARGEYVKSRSDLNLMVVLKRIELARLSAIGQLTRQSLSRFAPNLVFWTEEEIQHAWDVFPLEFADIQKRHQCLWGRDLFAKRKLDPKHLRFQLELELRSKLLRLRETWLELEKDSVGLERFLVKAGGSFEYLVHEASQTFMKKRPMAPELFAQLRELKTRRAWLARPALQKLYHQLHETIEAVVQRIDQA